MNANEINDLPRPVREAFRSIPDSTFDDDEELIELREKLAAINAEHQLRQVRAGKVRARIAELKAVQGSALADVSRISAMLPGTLARAMLEGDDIAEGEQLQKEIETHQRRADNIDLAAPALQRALEVLIRGMESPARQAESVEDKIKALLDDLRLELARSRWLG